MQDVAFVVPLLPGTEEQDRVEMHSCWRGERMEAHHEARAALGITRESVWAQETPAGKVAVVYLEAEDPWPGVPGNGHLRSSLRRLVQATLP